MKMGLGTVFGIELSVISIAIIAIVFLLIFGIPFATIAFFIATNIKIVLIIGAMLFVLNLLFSGKK